MSVDRYRVVGGKYVFYSFREGQLFNNDVWLENDGRFEKVNGEYAEYYNEDGSLDQGKAVELEVARVKAAVRNAIDTMRVEVDGIGYDGDETSQDRMNRAIQTLVGDETMSWRVYDNSAVVVSQTELGKAMRLAGIMMSRLWFCGSVEEVEAIVAEDALWLAKYEGE
jgi:hypothetical protein